MTNENYFKPFFQGVTTGRRRRILTTDVGAMEEQLNANLPLLLEPQRFQQVSREPESASVESFGKQWARVTHYLLIQKQRALSDMYFGYGDQDLPWNRKSVNEEDEEHYLQDPTKNQYYGGQVETLKQIKPDTAAIIAAESQTRGISVDEYLKSLLPSSNGDEERLYQIASAEVWVNKFREWASSHSIRPIIADDSRESIYEGRGE